MRVSQGTGASRKYVNKTFRGTLAQAKAYARTQETLLDSGFTPDEIKLTFAEAAKLWLAAIEKKLAVRTLEGYREYLARYASESLDKLKLSEIKSDHVQKIYDRLTKENYSPTTVRNLHAALSALFNYFVKKESLRRNPCAAVDLPAKDKDEIVVLDETEIPGFVRHCQTAKNGLIFEFALETGMRPEEYLALRWRDIDFKRNQVAVVQAVAFNRSGGGYYFKAPKTKSSVRRLDISEALRERLIRHRSIQNEHRMKLKVSYAAHDLVFPNEIGTPYPLNNLTRRYFHPILKKCGFIEEEIDEKTGKITERIIKNVTLYSLRHTCATILLMEGEDANAVARRLGHSSVKTLLDNYAHVLPSMQKRAAQKLDYILRAGKIS